MKFSQHIKDIYGVHAAQRAKEAGLRAMWANEKGEPVANVGPREAGILKPERKARYLNKSRGRDPRATVQPQDQFVQQPRQAQPYAGEAYGRDAYGPEISNAPATPQKYNTPAPPYQPGPVMAATTQQAFTSHQSRENARPHSAAPASGPYYHPLAPQQDGHHLNPSGHVVPQERLARRPSPGARVPHEPDYRGPPPAEEMARDRSGNYSYQHRHGEVTQPSKSTSRADLSRRDTDFEVVTVVAASEVPWPRWNTYDML
ncbi:hypothetical protein F5Y17DRAFT_200226 [Xylariaceae sp. FL0594]|nr:hypothetical protein F5Y17DRAFT_200226 [Xylariaceae sp. FL0594]